MPCSMPCSMLLKAISAALGALLLFAVAPSLRAEEKPASLAANIQARGSLNNSRLRFDRDKQGRVAFIGGSITEMDGYRPLVCKILQKRFPETEFTFINAGISSTCSTTGAFRLEHDVLSAGPIDLFFIEFAVNDDQDAAHTRDACIRGLEGIIRHARRSNPQMDIAVAYFVNEGMLATFDKGGTPLSVDSHAAVAKHYEISTIDLAKEVFDEMAAGTLTWKQFGGVHPAPHGNGICASMIDELLTQAWSKPLGADAKPAPHAMPMPLDPLNYERGRFLPLAQAKIVQGWKVLTPNWKEIKGSTRSRFTSIPLLCADESGAELTLEFDGTAVGAYIVAGPDAGIVESCVDNGSPSQANLLHRFSGGLHYPRTVMFATDLPPGPHKLTLRMTGETKSTGHAMRIVHWVAN